MKPNLPLKGFISKFNFCTNPGLTQLWTTWPSAARCNVTICFVRVHVTATRSYLEWPTMQECDVMWKLSMILKYILLFALGNICGYDSNVRYVFTCLNLKMNGCLSKLYSWSNKRCEFQQNLRKMYWYHYYKSMFTAVLIFVFKYNVEAKISFAGCTAFIEVLKIKLIILFY